MKGIVFTARGCPVGCLGPYGNEWIATPNFDRLSAEGIVYDRHFADVPDADAARKQWWNPDELAKFPKRLLIEWGTNPGGARVVWPEVHQVGEASEMLKILADTLETVNDSDWLIWIDTDNLVPPWQVPQEVFEVYCEELMEDLDPDDPPKRVFSDEEEEDEEEVEVEVEEDPLTPNPSPAGGEGSQEEAITPWSDPPVGWFDQSDQASWELLHRSFAAVVTAFDAQLGRIQDAIRNRGLDSQVTFAFTSDFGYPLGEHGLLGPHRAWLYEEFVHLPLIVRRPGATEAGLRIAGFKQTPDLWPILHGGFEPSRNHAITQWEKDGSAEVAIRTETHALLVPLKVPEDDDPREPELYEKPGDRWEANDLRPRQMERADELEAELRLVLASGAA